MTTAVDVYPTRLERLERPYMARLDPVVHRDANGESKEGPLSAEALKSYDEKGFLVCPRLINEEQLKAIRMEVERLRNEADSSDDRVVLEPRGEEIRSIFEVHKQSRMIHALLASDQLAGVARQILGSDVYAHQTRLNLKPGFLGKEFYWHSDFETWHSEDGMPRMRALSCVVNLTDNFEYNGPLMIVPGSQRMYIQCQGETPDNHYKQSLRKQQYGVPSHEALKMLFEKWGVESMTGPAGTVVFFDCNAMHGSNGNITPLERNNLFFVFNSVENALVEPFCGLKPRPNYIAERESFEAL